MSWKISGAKREVNCTPAGKLKSKDGGRGVERKIQISNLSKQKGKGRCEGLIRPHQAPER